MLEPELLKVAANGIEIAVWHWPGAGPPFFFVHATGFHARIWDQIIRLLPNRECYAMDMRGHGQSTKLLPPCNWQDSGGDVQAVVQALALKGSIGVGHSMGGHSLCWAQAHTANLFSGLLLIDPVIMKPEFYRQSDTPLPDYKAHPVAHRRNHWLSAQALAERYQDRKPFSLWDEAVLQDYSLHALAPNTSGGDFVLACAPEYEASIYVMSESPSANIDHILENITVPVLVIRAGEPRGAEALSFAISPTNPQLASRFPRGRDLHFAEYSHFLPMENPQIIADCLKEFAGEQYK